MSWLSCAFAGLLLLTIHTVTGQFPKTPLNLSTIQSKFGIGASISYKQTFDCESTSSTKSYAGYVHLPPSTEANYSSNIFFLYFESSVSPDTAPLTLWISGGPGESSTMAAYGENGPCIVQPDSTTVKENQWSWANSVNMLYIDQPLSTGFSYSNLSNGTIDQTVSSTAITFDQLEDSLTSNTTFLHGTFASQENVANTTGDTAVTIWKFLQVWTQR